MKIARKVKEMQEYSDLVRKKGESIGFVPTMGYLHEGHLSLVRKAREENDKVIVSIFVNPTQFLPGEDFNRYPRDEVRDLKMLEELNIDCVFIPETVNEIYKENYLTYVKVESLQDKLCGASRPGHFKGVTTVVLKLFNIIKPHCAYFGKKDFQQYVIIKKMTEDLNLDINIIGCPIIREEGGLAMSSRNVYLSDKERKEATILSKSLFEAKKLIESGERNTEKVKESIINNLKKAESLTKIDYVSIVNQNTLEDLVTLKGAVLIALAVFFGKTRLIDNIDFEIN